VNNCNGKPSQPALSRLDEVAELLSMGLKRARLRAAAAENSENSTGLCDEIERVLVPENGQ
jgi:hypothetical protein